VQDSVEVPANLAALLESDIRAEEDAKLNQNYQPVSPQKLWDGRFTMPVTGEIITQFGSVRSYNGGPFVTNHGGTDIAVPMGTPVLAPARGKVVFIDTVKLRGNMITLDHGLGVYTTYGHLSAIDVKIGDTVERGQPIGKVGTTGLSTGPHLHYEFLVNGRPTNPQRKDMGAGTPVPHDLRSEFDAARIRLRAELDRRPSAASVVARSD
jgi:murein DD-endopeptidase MepM/ murein hydrolase activator NlpD